MAVAPQRLPPGRRAGRIDDALLRERVPRVETGEFGAMMDVELVNDGPVTLLVDR